MKVIQAISLSIQGVMLLGFLSILLSSMTNYVWWVYWVIPLGLIPLCLTLIMFALLEQQTTNHAIEEKKNE